MSSEHQKEYMRQYRQTHKDECRAAQNKWREEHKNDPEYIAKVQESHKKWRDRYRDDPEYKEARRLYAAAYRQTHKKELSAKQAEYNRRYMERQKQNRKRYKFAPPKPKTPAYLLNLDKSKSKAKYKSPAQWLIHKGKLTAKEVRKLSEDEILTLWLEEI